jgi:hypothetical protein
MVLNDKLSTGGHAVATFFKQYLKTLYTSLVRSILEYCSII